MTNSDARWSFWIDVGGTFTDCVGRSPDGKLHTRKLLNRLPADAPGGAPVAAIRSIMGLGDDEPIGPVNVRLGTTRGTNALLERKGASVGFITTRGFADLIEIGTQARPHLFKLDIVKPAPLYQTVAEIDERLAADGEVLTPLDELQVESRLARLREQGIGALGVCLINAYANPAHEQRVAQVAESMGFEQVSTSTGLTPTIGALDRAQTSVLDAYLSPVIRGYVRRLLDAMPQVNLQMMTSAGALVHGLKFAGKDSLLSGPAGGVVGFAHVAEAAGFEQAIGFDMGGTSTDVARYDGEYEYQYTGEKAGVRVVSPMYAIETVAAGGGSICRFDGQRLTVGPDSAGADPGPACYGRGGPLTVTDINLFNGKIDRERFPFALDDDAVKHRLDAIAEQMDHRMSPREIADGFTRVANLRMATAIRAISAARGYDPADHVLVSFGGAGAQHACAIAGSLGIERVLLSPLAGILSAWGIGMADVKRFAEKSVLRPLDDNTLAELESEFAAMDEAIRAEVADEVDDERNIQPPVRLMDLRYEGEQTPITVRQPDDGDWAGAFAAMHQQLYGHVHHDRAIEIATMRIEVTGRTDKPAMPTAEPRDRRPEPTGRCAVYFDGVAHDAARYERERLHPGDRIDGPAIVAESFSTIVIDPGWTAVMNEHYDLVVTHHAGGDKPATDDTTTVCDPVRLELFNNHFTHIATQMGTTLQRTALSVNVKQRLDFSCAILDANGDLVVNAPHIPVHLGAMSESVRGLLHTVKQLRPGEAYITNDPDLGGSHLPDLTVITPVFDASGEHLRFFTASRAHHAEIGGLRPGSAFPFAKNLAEEGVVLRNLRIVRDGRFDEASLREALVAGPYPSRAVDVNVADVRAALAANHVGWRELTGVIDRFTWPVVNAYMGYIRDAAAAQCRAAIAALDDGQYTFDDALDDGAPLKLTITVAGDRMTVDFTGTGPVNDNSLNANRAIVQAAVLYCLRCLIDQDIPLNAGVLDPVEIVLPECMLNPPVCEDATKHAAVVGGNVELSQRIVDMFFGALGIAAASQGTMNNFVFGNDRFGYYETLGGGAGAGPDFDGASAVHTHMTNTRLTDVEILEQQYPLRVRQFAVREGSGGEGEHRGGDGITRAIEYLQPMQVSLLTQRRTKAPFGLHSGGAGEPGRNLLRRTGSDTDESLPSLAEFDVNPGDVVTLQTPGGGGFG
ncbi:hydantoinase [Planctomycetales bacterium ZRK34]|nr:hydantoinase [Planctomycetales bacterium ZRK34]